MEQPPQEGISKEQTALWYELQAALAEKAKQEELTKFIGSTGLGRTEE